MPNLLNKIKSISEFSSSSTSFLPPIPQNLSHDDPQIHTLLLTTQSTLHTYYSLIQSTSSISQTFKAFNTTSTNFHNLYESINLYSLQINQSSSLVSPTTYQNTVQSVHQEITLRLNTVLDKFVFLPLNDRISKIQELKPIVKKYFTDFKLSTHYEEKVLRLRFEQEKKKEGKRKSLESTGSGEESSEKSSFGKSLKGDIKLKRNEEKKNTCLEATKISRKNVFDALTEIQNSQEEFVKPILRYIYLFQMEWLKQTSEKFSNMVISSQNKPQEKKETEKIHIKVINTGKKKRPPAPVLRSSELSIREKLEMSLPDTESVFSKKYSDQQNKSKIM
eukprot:snap_masked-scaffold_21-processed-gene-1.3-mRNA-1 protein AED:1.00 eAED:1.00 QI:0/0/0/0/1/1/3/0/333